MRQGQVEEEEEEEEEQGKKAQRGGRDSMSWGFRGLGSEVGGRVEDRVGRCLRWRIWVWRWVSMGLILGGGSFIDRWVGGEVARAEAGGKKGEGRSGVQRGKGKGVKGKGERGIIVR